MASEALRLQSLFNEANLPVIFLKGTSLLPWPLAISHCAAAKISILVPYEILPAATAFISGAGYCPANLRLTSMIRNCSGLCRSGKISDSSIMHRPANRASPAAILEPVRHGRDFFHGLIAGRTFDRGCRTPHARRRRSLLVSLHARRAALVESPQILPMSMCC